MASVSQVSDVAHGPFVLIDYTFFFFFTSKLILLQLNTFFSPKRVDFGGKFNTLKKKMEVNFF